MECLRDRVYRKRHEKRPPEGGLISRQITLGRYARSRTWLWLRSSRSCRSRLIQDPVMDGKQRQFQPVRHADLVIDVAQIVLDHLLGGSQLRRDFLVLVTL